MQKHSFLLFYKTSLLNLLIHLTRSFDRTYMQAPPKNQVEGKCPMGCQAHTGGPAKYNLCLGGYGGAKIIQHIRCVLAISFQNIG